MPLGYLGYLLHISFFFTPKVGSPYMLRGPLGDRTFKKPLDEWKALRSWASLRSWTDTHQLGRIGWLTGLSGWSFKGILNQVLEKVGTCNGKVFDDWVGWWKMDLYRIGFWAIQFQWGYPCSQIGSERCRVLTLWPFANLQTVKPDSLELQNPIRDLKAPWRI